MTAPPRQWLTASDTRASDTRLVVGHMTRIRIAIAAALMLAAGFGGGMAHGSHSQAPARPAAVASGPTHNSPVTCC
jgi:hypothetical protein